MSSSRPRRFSKGPSSPDAPISSKLSDNASSSPNPSADVGRFQRSTRRTGIKAASPGKIPLEIGTIFEDMDAFFQSSHRPAYTHSLPTEEQQKESIINKATLLEEKKNTDDSTINTNKVKDPTNYLSRKFNQNHQRQVEKEQNSLKYQQHMANLAEPNFDVFKNNITLDGRSEEFATESIKSGKYLQLIMKKNRSRNSYHLNIPRSPSELSDVSTIPPTPAPKTLAYTTKSILRSATGNKPQTDEFINHDNTPFSSASDKSVRWNVDEDYLNNLQEDESESKIQSSGKKKTNLVNYDETDDLYPSNDDDDNISGLFVSRESSSAQKSLNSSLDRAAALLPTPPADMRKNSTGPTFDDTRSPPPLEESMIDMLNNTDDAMNEEEEVEEGSSHDTNDPHKTNSTGSGSEFISPEETNDFANQNIDNNEYEDDEDKEGEGFAITSHDSDDLEEENMDHRSKKSKVKAPVSGKETQQSKKRGRKPKGKVSPVSPDSPLNTSENKKKKQKKSKKQTAYAALPGFKGHAVGNRDYETIPVSDFQDDEENDDNVRRSKRARFKPLEYWRNEKLVYDAHHETGVLGQALGLMPIVSGVVRALPTPHAVRKANRKQAASESDSDEDGMKPKKKGGKKKAMTSSESDEFDSSHLRKKYEIHDDDKGLIWSESMSDICETQIVSYFDPERFVKLPTNRGRSKFESKVSGKAVQSFNAPTVSGRICPWLSGLVELPPLAIKDAEGVGSCLQHFHVIECQPKALEFALADPEDDDGKFQNENAQRFLLSKGDAFYVPPGNIYRLENHSKSESCLLSYTIFRPYPETDVEKKEKR